MRNPLTRVQYVKDLKPQFLGGFLHRTRPTLCWNPVESILYTPGVKRGRRIYGLESMEEAKAICQLTNVKFVDNYHGDDGSEGE